MRNAKSPKPPAPNGIGERNCAPQASPREEFAAVLRELGGDLTGEHPVMDGRSHRMATLDDDRGEKSMFYIAHSDGRPAGYPNSELWLDRNSGPARNTT
jgi:phage/plasmid primase-like uncharacterized protein